MTTREEERNRLYALIESANSRLDRQKLISEKEKQIYEITIAVRDKEIDRLRKMLGMKPLKEQKPAQVLRLIKK